MNCRETRGTNEGPIASGVSFLVLQCLMRTKTIRLNGLRGSADHSIILSIYITVFVTLFLYVFAYAVMMRFSCGCLGFYPVDIITSYY